jgi:hypothetical protein
MIDLFSSYLHSSFIRTEQSLDFLKPSEPVSQHPLVLLDQISNSLQFDSRKMEFYTVIHTMPQTEPF